MLLFLLIDMKKMKHENNPRRNFKVAMQKTKRKFEIAQQLQNTSKSVE